MQATPKAPELSTVGAVNEVEVKSGPNYTLAQLGETPSWRRYGVQHPAIPTPVMGKVFLKSLLNLTGMEISVNVLPAGASVPFLHSHRQNEEVYLFVRGKGQIQIDGDVLDVQEGTAVRIAPAGARCWRNTSQEDLAYVVIQAKEGSLTAWTRTDGVGVPGPVTWPEKTC
jgi:mannose-6-phosphate isomerase-like protein (cupin superfamily)